MQVILSIIISGYLLCVNTLRKGPLLGLFRVARAYSSIHKCLVDFAVREQELGAKFSEKAREHASRAFLILAGLCR